MEAHIIFKKTIDNFKSNNFELKYDIFKKLQKIEEGGKKFQFYIGGINIYVELKGDEFKDNNILSIYTNSFKIPFKIYIDKNYKKHIIENCIFDILKAIFKSQINIIVEKKIKKENAIL